MQDDSPDRRTIDVSITADATPMQAWEAWADPEKLAGWFVDRAEGNGRRADEIMTWFFDRFGLALPYRVVTSVPGERITFGPGSDEQPPFVLDVILTRDGGDTRIRIVNSGFSADAEFDDQFDGIDSGWRMALGALKEYLERHFGEDRSIFMALRPIDRDPAAAYPFFIDRDRLRQWLEAPSGAVPNETAPDDEGDLGAVGQEVSLHLEGGGTLSGPILARTDVEVALAWREINGVCELKAFRQGPQTMLCVRGFGWGMGAEEAAKWEARMEDALGRLDKAITGAVSP